MPEEISEPDDWSQIVRRHAWWVVTAALYAAIMSVTTALYMADTIDYAGSIEVRRWAAGTRSSGNSVICCGGPWGTSPTGCRSAA